MGHARTENNVTWLVENHRKLAAQRTAFRWASVDAGTATVSPHEGMTYGELGRRVEVVAGGLWRLGLRPGDRVLVFLPMSGSMYVTMFAAQRLGAAAVFLDSWARREQLGFCAALVEPKLMVAPERAYAAGRNVSELAAIPVKVVVGPHAGSYSAALEDLELGPGGRAIEPVEAEATALITFTTGSSGRPKGANRTHEFLLAQHAALRSVIPYFEQDVDLPVFPIFSLNNVAAGVTTVLPAVDLARPAPEDGPLLVAQMRDQGVTCCTLSPSLLRGVAAHCLASGQPLPGLRRVVTGGAPVSREDIAAVRAAAPRAEIWVLYGSTEVEPIAHVEAREILARPGGEPGTLVGPIVGGLRCRLLSVNKGPVALDERGFEPWLAAGGQPGEVVVAGAHVCRGYYRDEDAFTRTKIVEADGTVWHRTGDVGYLDEHAHLHLVGRVHNSILRAGQLLYPVTPEILLSGVEGVRQSAYVGLPDRALGECAAAVVSLRSGVGREQVEAAVRRVLGRHGVPLDRFYVVDEVPMDPRHHSKVEYAALRERLGGAAP
jgi:acyl-CoA synthetase (AMP-forming)/AMP-acid ligase II